jgi:hypothetical protein
VQKPQKTLAVVMQRRPSRSRWESVVWEPWSVVQSEEPTGAARLLVEQDGVSQWLHPGFELVIHRDEIEGYYMNVSSESPRVFILWRMEGDQALPLQLSASYDEGGRWLDGGHSVDGVAMPPEIFAWIGEYVEQNYRPQPHKRIKPRSFIHPKDRAGR